MTTPDPEPQKRLYAKEVTTVSGARGMSAAVTALMMAGRMKEAMLLHVYQMDDMEDQEWEELICLISHRVSHRRASALRPDKTQKPQGEHAASHSQTQD